MMKLRLGLPSVTRFGGYWLLWIPLLFGSINVTSAGEPLLFSERYGKRKPMVTIGPYRFKWVKFR